ncbi:CRISPR-associated helicase, Cas3 family [Halopenitus malekzadehii]|uniref:CRISPR-associated helicase, Cas3 family n=1 Tax=Halopenitus malekzadehii TaxID=1267564 RepID=A0A1H6JRP3_9EURY|nr:CRISPR-associated endonuclease Cas3'' [Halopenitus malekzadehii]SEH65166.1 CRISPR-associated helicase, Cas3 family [Halopenitus malekzadehii]
MSIRYSHPPEDGHKGVYLRDHLDDVARRANEIVPDRATTPEGESLQRVVETLAYVHDFGKATTFFQEYLRHNTEPEYKPCRYHAPIGSFAAYYVLDAQGFETETSLAGFVAVAKHHGRLPDVTQYIYDRAYNSENSTGDAQTSAEQQQAAIAMQLNDIDEHVSGLAADILNDATDSHGSWDGFRHSYKGLLDEITAAVATESGTTISRDSLSDSCYGLVLECWGSLVLADKTSAASRSEDTSSGAPYKAERPSMQVLDEYVDDIESSSPADPDGSRTERLNHYRSRARSAVIGNAEEFAEEGGGVATLTLPTGMGKTLSGLSAAQTIRDERGGERIVYALPFTSIIDQVVDEVEEIYETDTPGRLLTAHHHLSETKIVDEDDVDADKADRNDDVAGMLAESWRAGLTVTTFVQLFESLAGPANKQSMKISALRDSVVILDEPQSLPLDWWKLVPRLVTILTEQYNATVIAMTATQPQLFDAATERIDNVSELVDDPDVYFEATERVQYELDASAERYIETQSEPKAYPDAGAELLSAVDAGASTLAVCNTIDSARALFDELTGSRRSLLSVGNVYADELDAADTTADIDPEALAIRIKNQSDASILHLSTRLRPLDRLKLIETAKELTDDEHGLITVSTQLIEAGVDISFDRVYRDLAPIDSIVQAAGRCNRSFEREQGRVVIWWLDVPEEQKKTPAEAVYNRGATLLPVAAETLDSVREADTPLSETAVARTAVTEYYRRLHTDKNVGKQEYVEYVDDLRGDKLRDLSLIDQRNAVDIIICRTTAEREQVEQVRDAWKQYEFNRVRRLMDELKELRVSIPIYHEESDKKEKIGQLNRIHEDTDVLCLDVREHGLSQYFDQNTGFVIPDSTAERRII